MKGQNIVIKSWIYEEIQVKAQQYMRTLVWEKVDAEDCLYAEGVNDKFVYIIKVADKVKETEKAICFDCVYWSTRSPRVNFTEYSGHKVWIPKSAILRGWVA